MSQFFQTSSAFGDLLDLSDHPLLLDIFSLGPPQLRTGLGFLFSFKVSLEKHPSDHSASKVIFVNLLLGSNEELFNVAIKLSNIGVNLFCCDCED